MREKNTFAELVDKIAEETGSSKQLVHNLLHETVNFTKEGLGKDGHVNILGLGRFHLKWHNTRSGRNPQTGDAIEIPAHNTVNYKPSADLRKYINRKYADLQAEILDEDKKPVIETAVTEPVTEAPITPPEEEKKKSLRWLWILIAVLILIFAYMIWNFWVKSETEKEPIVTEKVEQVVEEQAIVVEPIEEEPVEVQKPIGTPGGQQTIIAGDNLWTISQQYYNKADLWSNIYRVNLIEIENPDNLAIGSIIQVPSLEGKVGNLTHNDSANIAEGNIRAYLVYKKLNKTSAKNYLWVTSLYDVDNKLSQFSDEIDKEDLNLIKGMKLKE